MDILIPGNYEFKVYNLAGKNIYTSQMQYNEPGNYIIDCHFRKIEKAKQLEQQLNMIPGVVEKGLFINLCTRMIQADGEDIIVKDRNLS